VCCFCFFFFFWGGCVFCLQERANAPPHPTAPHFRCVWWHAVRPSFRISYFVLHLASHTGAPAPGDQAAPHGLQGGQLGGWMGGRVRGCVGEWVGAWASVRQRRSSSSAREQTHRVASRLIPSHSVASRRFASCRVVSRRIALFNTGRLLLLSTIRPLYDKTTHARGCVAVHAMPYRVLTHGCWN
jgi:hypothetical protein